MALLRKYDPDAQPKPAPSPGGPWPGEPAGPQPWCRGGFDAPRATVAASSSGTCSQQFLAWDVPSHHAGNRTPQPGRPGGPPCGAGPLAHLHGAQQPTGGTPASQLLLRTGNAAAAAAMGAGKALFPVFDTLANNVIGDNPELVHELM